ncbi:unnamed protein product [Ceratitis capitata]|uniref:(Mediterranean fruit fly) hypothetical protein n=1 Tax=Ceratitis capitata TaxID=7213 RepID=A0A811UNS3_CERCA|nr:unnamed protein product [Ceratitis capitata]
MEEMEAQTHAKARVEHATCRAVTALAENHPFFAQYASPTHASSAKHHLAAGVRTIAIFHGGRLHALSPVETLAIAPGSFSTAYAPLRVVQMQWSRRDNEAMWQKRVARILARHGESEYE